MSTWDLAVANLTSVPVLAFALGAVAVALGGDLRFPEPVHQALSAYLLFAIGLKGGVSLVQADPGALGGPLLATVALGVAVPAVAFGALRLVTRLGPVDRAGVAAHYGSTSLVTFTAALVFLDAAGEPYEGFMPTLLAVMEVPGIVVALLLAGRHVAGGDGWGAVLREVLTGRSVLLLAGGLAVGAATGPDGYEQVAPFFGVLFPGVLALFLLDMGGIAARRVRDLRRAGPGLVAFALAMPVAMGSLGVLAGGAAGLSVGGATVLGVLAGSASYIAAPAAVRLALPEANPAYSLSASLGLTFPFNLIAGIPILYAVAGLVG